VVVDRSEIASRKQHERAPSLDAENPAITTALEVTARSARSNIRVTKRRISPERALESADPSTCPPNPDAENSPRFTSARRNPKLPASTERHKGKRPVKKHPPSHSM
jgi:hypothetical protein